MVVGLHETSLLQIASEELLLCANHFVSQFEREFAAFMTQRSCSLVNSGSSANLLALSALELEKGSEVITCATGFPTTVNPIFQCGLIPVFVDCDANYQLDWTWFEEALSPKTKAVMVAHTLGNTFNINEVVEFCHKHGLKLIEDCCDAVGTTYEGHNVGTFGDIATASFYPAHHITTGEGGMVMTNNLKLAKTINSYRDWGRDCWCDPGKDNTCGKRFTQHIGDLPFGYDHKYVYSKIGYNLKATEFQGALGVAQMGRLKGFIEARKQNFKDLYNGLLDMQDVFILPQATEYADPSWFGFPLTVKHPYNRETIIKHLEDNGVGTRPLFGGNLTRQPAYMKENYRIVGNLINADIVMNDTFWIGVWPGVDTDYMLEVLHG